ncbi:tRNA(Ile)-lysidine synthase [Clavibacter sp.]|nr:tRNA(Ile)-lysidine synthase [Clavibacter sp.]
MEAGSKAITLSLMAETTPLYQIRLAVRSELEDIAAGDSVLVAASGGADSSALAAALLLECKTKSIKVIALIIDHGLQKNSADVTHETKRTLTKIGYENIEIRRVTVQITDGLEASARRARYQALNDVANSHNAVAVFLGHTKDDQAETVLLGLARGSGSRSLSGMASRVDRYRRPLLSITRAQTEAACEEAGIKFWQDPHNQSMEFTRVRVREVVLPTMEKEIGPGISDALARSAKLLRDDADALDYLSDEIFSKLEPASLEISKLESQPRAIRTRILRKAIYLAGAPQGSLSAEHIEPVEALITAWKGQGPISLPGGVTVARISGRLSLSKSGGQG